MKQIPLSQGQMALVDDRDFDYLSQFNWFVRWNPSTQSFYAQRNVDLGNGKRTSMQMHREILGMKRGDKRRVDHREPSQTLDNRRSNLRIATPAQNRSNSRLNRNNSCGLKGVRANYRRWVATIRVDKRSIYLGTFATKEDAHAAYRLAAERYRGDFARP